jgi:ferric-dicitrate binding protein FerR (iron transport regulator)
MTDYLWDRSEPVDPEIRDLEETLAPLRFKPGNPPAMRRSFRPGLRTYAAIAASIALAVAAWWVWPGTTGQATPWKIADVDGTVQIGRATARTSAVLKTGQEIRTGASSHAILEADDFGRVELQSGSELRMIESRDARQRFELNRGRIHALIWAPPSRFAVETGSARAIDLGCQYDLSVDEKGDGYLSVETGWVAFQFKQRESFIPAGAACHTARRQGPGLPFFEDASPAFREAVREYDVAGSHAALDRILAQARPRDGLTLWHLLTRVPDDERAMVFDRFSELVPLAKVDRTRVLARDREALDLCWNALGLDSAEWWRDWKRNWRD